MKKYSFLLVFVALASIHAGASDSLYHPLANAKKDIAEAIKKAKAENKHVLIQAGGNWCSWCLEFNRFTTTDKQMDSAINADYIVYHLNYSPQAKNFEVFKQYGFPNRFGFPVFLILDGNGKLIHTQNSSYLEEGKSYNKKKVLGFLADWKPKVLDEKNYGYLKN
ncbi:thioredoxin family protein [Sediminibacterium roseum]|uniref:Thioredoxin family protein n=1 Tax=Sediminibacterium roseum TaxID=1978412 RepID=A0ABW9ZWC5_9BACT|nr:thioredoxin family protein [Sediminibacterium roseum]NCI51451.1 thioredoxin family protein [Sediminibacterium roseum]